MPIFILNLCHYCRVNWNCNGRTSSLGLQPIASTYLRGLLISERSPIAMALKGLTLMVLKRLALKTPSNIPEIYAKMFGRIH